MKRTVLATVLGSAGLIGMALSSYGQGQIAFDNYNSTPYSTYPVQYGTLGQGVPANLAGTAAGASINVELGYFIGTSSSAAAMTLIPSSITAINTSLLGGGFFTGGAVTIPGYLSGPVSFEILAWSGASLATAAYSDEANPTIWTEASIPGPGLPAGFFSALNANTILTPTPEPTTLALAGLGGLASLVALRRKQA
jgi:hypothetical protein